MTNLTKPDATATIDLALRCSIRYPGDKKKGLLGGLFS